MNDFLVLVIRFAMLVFLLASMLDFGLGLSFRQVLAPLSNTKLLLLSLLANFIVVPLLALGIAKALRLEQPFASGLLLLGLAPGAPFLPKIVQLAHGNLWLAVGWMVLVLAGSVAYLPLVLPHVLVGAQVDAWKIEQSLLLLMFLPLIAGLVVHASFHSLPVWLRPSLGLLSNLSGLVVLVLLVGLHLGSVLTVFGTGAILAAVLFALSSALIGWLLGGAEKGARDVLALGTGLRNVAAALLVGGQNFEDPRVNVLVIVSALVALLILLPIARVLGKRANTEASVPSQSAGSSSCSMKENLLLMI